MHILFTQKTTSVGSLKIVTETHQNAGKGSHNPLVQDGSSNRKLGGLKKGPFDPDDPFTRSCASRRPVFDETLTSGVDGSRQPRESNS